MSIPGGTVIVGPKESLIRTTGEFYSAKDIAPVVLRANERGNWVQVDDVSEVSDTFEPITTIQRANGHRAINLVIVKKERSDAIDIVDDVKSSVEAFKSGAPSTLEISTVNDFSYYVKRRLSVLVSNGWMGMALVLVCLFMFLSSRVAIATAIGIPTAFLMTFIVMTYAGITINLLTMFGLIIVLGMIVDDAIIISENVHRHIEDGMPPDEAAIAGAHDVWRPVLSTVVTTIFAFAPLMFMTGIMGKFIMYIPLIVIIALVSSLAQAFFILPSHLVTMEKIPRGSFLLKFSSGCFSRWFKSISERYAVLLGKLLNRRLQVAAGASVFFIVSIYVGIFHIPLVLFPQKGIEAFFIRLKAPVGTPVEEMEKRLLPVELLVEGISKEEMDDYITQVGIMQQDDIDPFSERASHVAQIAVYLKPSSMRKMTADEIVDDLRKKVESVDGFKEITFEKVRPGPPVGQPVVVRVRGEELPDIEKAAEEIKDYLRGIKGVSDIKDSYELGKDEIIVDVDSSIASRATLGVEDIAIAIRTAFEGLIATTIKKADEEIDVRVRYPDALRYKEGALDKVAIPNGRGDLIPIEVVAKFRTSQV